METAPKLDLEVSALLEERREELELVDGQLEARRTEWVRDRQEAETKRQSLREQYVELKQQRERLAAAGEEGVVPDVHASARRAAERRARDARRADGDRARRWELLQGRLEQLLDMPEDVKALDERRRALFAEVGDARAADR